MLLFSSPIHACSYPPMITHCVLAICTTVLLCFLIRSLQGVFAKRNEKPQISKEDLNKIKEDCSNSIAKLRKEISEKDTDTILSLLLDLKKLKMDDKTLIDFLLALASYKKQEEQKKQEKQK